MNAMTQFLLSHGTPVLFLVVLLEEAGLPLPAAPWLLAAGALAAVGQLNLLVAVTVAALASMIADWTWFYIGRRGGQRMSRWFCRLSLNPNHCVHRSKGLLGRRGMGALIAGKFIPGLGAVMPPLTGALGLSAGRFLLFDGLGSLLYSLVYIVGGFLFHNQLEKAVALLRNIGLSALLFGAVLIVAYIAFKYVRRRTSLTRAKTAVVPAAPDAMAPELSPGLLPVALAHPGNHAKPSSLQGFLQLRSSPQL